MEPIYNISQQAANLNLETCQSTGLLTIEIHVTGQSSRDPKKWTCLVYHQITTCPNITCL